MRIKAERKVGGIMRKLLLGNMLVLLASHASASDVRQVPSDAYGAVPSLIKFLCKTPEGRQKLAEAQQGWVLDTLKRMQRSQTTPAKKAGLGKVIALQEKDGMKYLPKGCDQTPKVTPG